MDGPPAGGLAETPLHGGLVGPTFACVIGIQFRNLRKCDRFWYESGNPLIRFTESQLAEVRKITLAKVMYFVIGFLIYLSPPCL